MSAESAGHRSYMLRAKLAYALGRGIGMVVLEATQSIESTLNTIVLVSDRPEVLIRY